MKKTKYYYNVNLPLKTINDVYAAYLSKAGSNKRDDGEFKVWVNDEIWQYDTFDEFLASYSSAVRIEIRHFTDSRKFFIADGSIKEIGFSVALTNRDDIESVFEIIERAIPANTIKTKSKPLKVFIGHGRDSQWRDLKDHLHDKHGIDVEAYEIGPRAGLSVKEVLEKMLDESSFACLVLTGEDITTDGEIHARENVIHEVGLFQGRLGFKRAIVLLEDGVHEFSNILGINQIRFAKGNIKEVYGDVLATIKREFEKEG